ncbi:MAG: phosphate ABC transporter substrate-binding protein PstS family protein [Spirochaetales bacterium]|nr:phosphate ABC transporter substrate-binding protein PstS family protein [Spirochaetales bacterium]
MKKALAILALLLVAGMMFAGGSQAAPAAPMAAENDGPFAWVIDNGSFPQVDVLKMEGNIISAGSSTVFPAAEWIAAQLEDEGYTGQITIDSIGSGAGYERFVNGESDVSNASSKIKQSTIDAAIAAGRPAIEFRIGTDALAVVVNSANTWATDVTMEELAKIFTSDRWSDVNPAWPNQPILKFIPGTDSGTFEYFVEEVFSKDPAPMLASSNLQLSEDDNILVQGVEGSPNAVGFFGYAYYANEGAGLKILDIDSVKANTANVDNGTYPLARPLFMYSAANIMRSKPQVAAYLAYVLNNANEAMLAVGYFQAPVAAINGAKAAWLEAMKGAY